MSRHRRQLFAALVAASAVASAPGAAAGLSDCGVMQSDCRDLIGKRFWIVVPKTNPNAVELTTVPDDWKVTTKYRAGSFLVTGVRKDPYASHDFVVKMHDGKVGFVPASSWIFLSEKDPVVEAAKAARSAAEARAECGRRGQPKIGMTAGELVETCWGQPRRIVKRTSQNGAEERYIYTIGHIVSLTDGKVTEIVETR